MSRPTPTERILDLRAARQCLIAARTYVTSDVAPQTAKKIRSAIKSLDGAIRNAERFKRQEKEHAQTQ